MIALVVGAVGLALLIGIWLNRSSSRRRRRKPAHRIDLFARERAERASDESDGKS